MVSQKDRDDARVTRKRYLFVSLFLLALLVMTIAGLVSSYLEYKHFSQSQSQQDASNQSVQRRQQTTQDKQNASEQAKLCSTLTGLAALKAPAGNSIDNPSRAYEQSLQAKLSELSTDIGC